jgi:hypothetical protein
LKYLPIPNTDIKLVDGNIVVLDRFPGLKWVLHFGWYDYQGQSYQGWYFSSIPSQTIPPVSQQDLRMLQVVSTKSNDAQPEFPAPPDHHPQESMGCPHPIFPPVPPLPEMDRPAFFSVKCKEELDAAFITVPTIKKRNRLHNLPDGKIVRVNNVNGKPKYYVWSAYEEQWNDLPLVFQEDLDGLLDDYYTSTQINEYLSEIHSDIDEIAQSAQTSSEKVDLMEVKVEELDQRVSGLVDVEERVERLEEAVFNIATVAELTDSNTVLVKDDGTLKNSGVAIGDDEIGEPSQYASQKTLATEKAVAKKFEEAQLVWNTF